MKMKFLLNNLLACVGLSMATPVTMQFNPSNIVAVDHTMGGHEAPVIGVLTAPYCITSDPKKFGFNSDQCEDSLVSGFSTAETKFLEQGGAIVVPIPYNLDKKNLIELFSKLNGIFFTGGDASLKYDTTYYKTAKILFDLAKLSKTSGKPVPILGVCMGMQLLTLLVSQDYQAIEHMAYNAERVAWPLEKYQDGHSVNESKLFGSAPQSVIDTYFSVNMTANFHHDGFHSKTFRENSYLNDFYRIISINHDLDNNEFVSTIEAFDYDFYGVQWHPEVVQFAWSKADNFLDRTPQTIQAIQYVADFFIEKARHSPLTYDFTPGSKDMESFPPLYQYNYIIDTKNSLGVYLFTKAPVVNAP